MMPTKKLNPTEGMTPRERGQYAATIGTPINHCPFLKTSERSTEWRDGYESVVNKDTP